MADDVDADDIDDKTEEKDQEDDGELNVEGTEYGEEEESDEGSSASVEGEVADEAAKDKAFVEEAWGEMAEGEGEEGEEEGEKKKAEKVEEEEDEGIEEEVPPDPDAPYDLSDETEAQRAPFKLSEAQLAEVQELWDLFTNCTPAYADLDNFITPVELTYMLKALNLHTHTPAQTQELIEFCVRPPHPENHIIFDQFLWIVTIRQRDMPEEEEIRLALEVYDPTNSGILDREYVRETIRDRGYKMKDVNAFIKEVDMANDGTLGIEDVVGSIYVDLNRDEITNLLNQIYPPDEEVPDNIDALTS